MSLALYKHNRDPPVKTLLTSTSSGQNLHREAFLSYPDNPVDSQQFDVTKRHINNRTDSLFKVFKMNYMVCDV